MGTPPTSDRGLRAWLAALPKAELHLHLDGSLRPETAVELARERSLGADGEPLAGDSVLDADALRRGLVADASLSTQSELLSVYDLPVALLQDAEALERVTAELVEDVASDGTHYAEIRWAPSLHTRRGLPLEAGIEAVVRGARAAAARVGITVRLIVVALRTHAPAIGETVAELAVATDRADISGFDLAGYEADEPDPLRFARAFDIARAGGLGISCHAGEWGGAAQVRRALDVGPWRIAHGAPAIDDPALLAELAARGVTLDICPTSNLRAGIGSEDAEAPLTRLVRAGAAVTISTDGRTASDITLVEEMARAHDRLGLTADELIGLTRTAHAAAFLHADDERRAGLVSALESWLDANPPPA